MSENGKMVILDTRNGWMLGWDFPEEEDVGAFIGQEANTTLKECQKMLAESYEDREWEGVEYWTVEIAAREFPQIAGVSQAGYFCDSQGAAKKLRTHLKAAVAAARTTFDSSRVPEEWETRALASGWLPPKGYVPVGRTDSPFRDALRQVMGQEPPDYVSGWYSRDLSEENQAELQSWCASGMERTATPWGTGLGAIEAADQIVSVAVENGNLVPGPGAKLAEPAPRRDPPRIQDRVTSLVVEGGHPLMSLDSFTGVATYLEGPQKGQPVPGPKERREALNLTEREAAELVNSREGWSILGHDIAGYERYVETGGREGRGVPIAYFEALEAAEREKSTRVDVPAVQPDRGFVLNVIRRCDSCGYTDSVHTSDDPAEVRACTFCRGSRRVVPL